MGRLDGKVAVITGATALRLAHRRNFVAEARRVPRAARGGRCAALAGKLGAACVFKQTDVTDEAQVQALIATRGDRFAASTACSTTPAGRRRPAARGPRRRTPRRRDGDPWAQRMLGMNTPRADAAGRLRQHHQKRQHRRPSRRRFHLAGLRRCQARRYPLHQNACGELGEPASGQQHLARRIATAFSPRRSGSRPSRGQKGGDDGDVCKSAQRSRAQGLPDEHRPRGGCSWRRRVDLVIAPIW